MKLPNPSLVPFPWGRIYRVLAIGSFVLLGPEVTVGIFMLAVPGWANGWPDGFPMHVVWPIGLTGIFSTILATGLVGLSSLVGLFLNHSERSRRYAGLAFGIVLLAGATSAVIICNRFYHKVNEISLETWINGYNP